jgi:hypothetical protein
VKICHAPRYQGRLAVAERLQVLRSNGWKPASADELAAMCAADGEGDVAVIGIPLHLLKRWWELVESDQVSTGFEGWGRELVEYLKYKSWFALPPNVFMEVVAAGGKQDKKPVPSNPMRFSNGVGTALACINLSDENAAIALKVERTRIRIILEPGEGLTFPVSGVRWNRSVLGRAELAVTLIIGSLSTD